jgi:hypothetical protein
MSCTTDAGRANNKFMFSNRSEWAIDDPYDSFDPVIGSLERRHGPSFDDGGEDDDYASLFLQGNFLLIYIYNFHVLNHFLLIYIRKFNWDLNTMCVRQIKRDRGKKLRFL